MTTYRTARRAAFAIAVALTLAPAAAMPAALPEPLPAGSANVPVDDVDLARYAGIWNEAARLPMFFQRNCVSDTTATYTVREGGGLTVTNRCRKADGAMIESVGVARATARAGALEVTFLPVYLRWLPGTWADYWIVDLDPDYRWAVVGGPSRTAMWVLSRDQELPEALLLALKQRAEARGYDLDTLIVAPQKGGAAPPTQPAIPKE